MEIGRKHRKTLLTGGTRGQKEGGKVEHITSSS